MMSLRLLAFDLGNSRVKWGWFRDGELERHGVLGAEEEWPAGLPAEPDIVALAPTGPADRLERLRRRLDTVTSAIPVFEAVTERAFGDLVNSYADPATMGVDRWLAMVAARGAGEGACCVIDVGTALTVDVVGADGRHAGGWILPGEGLMREALALRTARVGAPPGAGLDGPWGQSTGACVAAGCSAAERAAAEAGVRTFLARWGEGHVFLTGGGLERVADGIRAITDSVTIDPALVLRGLARRAGA